RDERRDVRMAPGPAGTVTLAGRELFLGGAGEPIDAIEALLPAREVHTVITPNVDQTLTLRTDDAPGLASDEAPTRITDGFPLVGRSAPPAAHRRRARARGRPGEDPYRRRLPPRRARSPPRRAPPRATHGRGPPAARRPGGRRARVAHRAHGRGTGRRGTRGGRAARQHRRRRRRGRLPARERRRRPRLARGRRGAREPRAGPRVRVPRLAQAGRVGLALAREAPP